MGADLKKGEGFDFCAGDECDLSRITIGLGWDMASHPGDIPAAHYPGTPKPHEEHDLDAVAFLLGANGRVNDLGSNACGGSHAVTGGDVVFHKAPHHPSGAIWLTGDNRTGEGDGDDEQIIVKLDELDQKYHRILFLAVIHDGKHRGQHFGQVKNAFIHAVDANNRQICRYDISADASFTNYTSMTFAEVVRKGTGWRFQALGIPHESDRFTDLLKPYL
jgi:stress response protein SCP2